MAWVSVLWWLSRKRLGEQQEHDFSASQKRGPMALLGGFGRERTSSGSRRRKCSTLHPNSGGVNAFLLGPWMHPGKAGF